MIAMIPDEVRVTAPDLGTNQSFGSTAASANQPQNPSQQSFNDLKKQFMTHFEA